MERRRFLALLGSAVLARRAGGPARAGSTDLCGVAVLRSDGWPVVDAAEGAVSAGAIDRAALRQATERFAASSGFDIHSVLVAQHGRLAFERYFRGSDEVPGRFFGSRTETIAFDADTIHNMKSVSKSVSSLVLGIALDRGLIPGLDTPMFRFFPEASDLRSPEKDRILLRHVLTMSLGLSWEEATPAAGDFANDEARMNLAWDPCRYVLGWPAVAPAGTAFFYNTVALRLLSVIVHRATGMPLDAFARTTLFEPLSIAADWARVRGETDAGGGLRLRPRDRAKLGQLVLAGGRWNNRQIVSQAWIKASTSPQIKATDGQDYGYLWWVGRTRLNGREIRFIAAQGRGGQTIRIVPELDLVVAVIAGYYQDYSPHAFRVQFGVFRDVLRAARM